MRKQLALVGVFLVSLSGCAPGPDSAKLPGPAEPPPSAGTVVRTDPAGDALIAPDAKIQKLAGGFTFTEGPIWIKDGGHLLFSDIPANVIRKWTPDGQVTVFMENSGYDAGKPPREGFIGSNGLTLDSQGRLIIMQMGNGQVARREPDGKITVLADKYQGKRLNSPNDAVYKSDGSLYFTDPPYGFVKQD